MITILLYIYMDCCLLRRNTIKFITLPKRGNVETWEVIGLFSYGIIIIIIIVPFLQTSRK